jgi:hypothetical protein
MMFSFTREILKLTDQLSESDSLFNFSRDYEAAKNP